MATKREYLKAQGITVGARGRFSSAAKQALSEAAQKGITFTAESPTSRKKQDPLEVGVGSPFVANPHPIMVEWSTSRKRNNGTEKNSRRKIGGSH